MEYYSSSSKIHQVVNFIIPCIKLIKLGDIKNTQQMKSKVVYGILLTFTY